MHHTMKAYRKMEAELHTFLTLTLDGDARSASCPREISPQTQ